MNYEELIAEKLRDELQAKIRTYEDAIRVLRYDHVGLTAGDAIIDAVVAHRYDLYVANQYEAWVRQARQATSIDDLVAAAQLPPAVDRFRPDMATISQYPPLPPETAAQLRQMVEDGRESVFSDSPIHPSWAEASGLDEVNPEGWNRVDPAAGIAQPYEPPEPERTRGHAKKGTGAEGEGAPDPRDTAGGARGRVQQGAGADGQVDPRDTVGGARPPGPPERAESPDGGTIKERRPIGPPEEAAWGTAVKTLGTVAVGAAAAARTGLSLFRVVQIAGGGLLILALVYGGWRLWSSAPDPEASPVSAEGELLAVRAEGTMTEKASAYATFPFTTAVEVVADRHPLGGSVQVTLDGETTFDATFDCMVAPEGVGGGQARTLLAETKPARVNLAYEKIEVSSMDVGTFDAATGTFAMPFDIRIVRQFEKLLRPFEDSRCKYLNDNQPHHEFTDQFLGTGNVEGTVSFDSGTVTLRSHWEWAEGITVEGEVTLEGSVEHL